MLFLFVLGLMAGARAANLEPLRLEAKIALGSFRGRIDHLALDRARQLLFVAEYGNNAVGVVDVQSRKLVRTVAGLDEPQGVAYFNATLYVANGGDGTLRLFHGPNLIPAGRIALGDDADNVRTDEVKGALFVGHASGALAVIDAASGSKVGDVRLKAHPEGFELDPAGHRIFVNVPDAGEVAVVDRESGKVIGGWKLNGVRENFAMAFDHQRRQVVIVTRSPPRLVAFSAQTGAVESEIDTCADADDVFIDARRHRSYVSCGAGSVDVFDQIDRGYNRAGSVPTAAGARTSLFAADLDLLFVAVRATSTEPAAVWMFRPM